MTAILDVFIPIEPIGKQRPRLTKGGHVYTPTKTADAERRIRYYARLRYKKPPYDGPVHILVQAFFPRPKSVPKRRRHPIVTPDWDNIGKLVSDALNGVAYVDDKQIVSAHVEKKYCDTDWLCDYKPGIRVVVDEVY